MSNIALVSPATGTATFSITTPSGTSTDRTLTLPDNSGTVLTSATTTGFPAGSVIQVVQGFTTTGTTTSSITPVDTTLSATITPTSASSKILVLMNSNGYTARTASVTFGDAYFYMIRGATEIAAARTGINFGVTTWTDVFPAQNCLVYLDSPATTSATTYKMQISVSNSIPLTAPFQSFASMTLLEIAA